MSARVIEKSNNGLFENEIEFTGRYARIARHLRDDLGLFTSFREVYVTAAVIGFVNKRKGTEQQDEKIQPASIFPNELSKRKHDLRFLYRIIMLSQDEKYFTIEDYMNRAFRDDAEEGNVEKLKENMSLFHSFVSGGLEFLDEKFGAIDRTDDVVDALYDLVHNFAVDVGEIESDDLPDFEPSFN